MRFEVPQFIEEEDKIFGPFTWRQFVYMAGTAGAVVGLYFTLPLWLFVVPGVMIAGLGAALSFYKINNRPFVFYLESVYHFLTNTRLYTWEKKDGGVYRGRTQTAKTAARPSGQTDSIKNLARKLELNELADEEAVVERVR